MKGIRNTSTSASPATADAYQVITDRIIAKMEGGEIPWQKPWHSLGAPRNFVTGHMYTGINAFLLHFLSEGLPFFMTYRQAQDLGGYIRKGAKGFPIIFYNVVEKETEDGQTKKTPFVKYCTVFNIADVEGVELVVPEFAPVEHEPIAAAEAIVTSWADRPRITHMDQQAYYVPATDYVNMPLFSSFRSAEQYYQTLFHELTHSTGHRQRLNRPDLAENMAVKGTEGYAREELTAEMGAAFLCGAAGINPEATDDNTAAYLQFWLGRLKADKTLLIKAASHAQKAANLILGADTKAAV
ncbi:ArdC family protein [Hymenobacter sp. GOD-10R]|uniref:ArdC family protein n=1 Tax=Hymenobacter sp. GOD-10R TaxID=3093922 RepID=UPI002D767062|nr:zincin-like metallopeptidase domain-containing protein [Hymenobacter sp. GOD-10R]WRQ31943.1 zincin-like metallopeptidase domain-containing protein [Hymenobacter sp. GOD-10R]